MNEVTTKQRRTPSRVKFTPVNTIAMVAAVCAVPMAVILLKLSSQEWAKKLEWWDIAFWTAIGYFALGNVVGFTTTIGKTIALRDNPPNTVYAIVGAPSTVVLHFALAWYFNITLTPTQWLAIGVIIFGAVLLQCGSGSREDEVIVEVVQHLEEGEQQEHREVK